MSLSPSRKPAGSTLGSVWLSSTRRVPPRRRPGPGVQPAVLDPQVVEQPQRLPGEVAELGVSPLGLQLGDHDDGQHHLVLVEAQQRERVGEQDAGVEHEGARRSALARAVRSHAPGPAGSGRTRRVARGPGPGREGRSPALSARAGVKTRLSTDGPPERRRGAVRSRRYAGRRPRGRHAEPSAARHRPRPRQPPKRRCARRTRAARAGSRLPEVRPVGLAEVELRVRALPEQEAGQPLLAGGADHQVGVGLAPGVEVLGDVLDVEDARRAPRSWCRGRRAPAAASAPRRRSRAGRRSRWRR